MSKHIFEEAFEALPKRTIKSLLKSGYDTLEELHELSDKELIEINGVGKKSVNTIRGLLAAQGFEIKFDADPEAEATALAAAHKLTASRGVPEKEGVREPGTGARNPRRSGQVVMKINLVDDGYRRKNNGQKLSVVIGDVVWGNKDKEWDLDRDYVDALIAKGDAA